MQIHTSPCQPVNLDLIGLEKIAQEIAANARRAFNSAQNYPEGSYGRRFIEHGAVCYFNSYNQLKRFIDTAAKSTQQSA
jgi:hypothetical protein